MSKSSNRIQHVLLVQTAPAGRTSASIVPLETKLWRFAIALDGIAACIPDIMGAVDQLGQCDLIRSLEIWNYLILLTGRL